MSIYLKMNYKSFMEDMEKNIKNKEDLEYVKGRTSEFLNVILDQMEGIVNYRRRKNFTFRRRAKTNK